MNIPIPIARLWRIAKRSPARAVRDWFGVLGSESQIFSFCLAVFTSWIGIQTATIPEIMAEANSWSNAIQAFFYVAIGWGAICLVRSPFVTYCDEIRLGKWYGNRFVYSKPHLVATLRCKATGQP